MRICQALPFWKFGRRFNPPQQKGREVHTVWKLLVDFLWVLPYRSCMTLPWLISSSFSNEIMPTYFIHSRFVTRWKHMKHLWSLIYPLNTAIFASNNSAILVNCLEGSCPYLQILIYNFSGIVSVICSNSPAEVYSITEGEGC